MLYRLLIFALLMVTWLVFSGLFDAFHITLGILSAAFVTWISSDMLFDNREISAPTRLGQAVRMVRYLAWLLWQVVLSNMDILKLALSPDLKKVEPRIVKIQTGLKSDFEKFLLANSITLTPGTITVKILGDVFYVHAISEHAAKGLDGEMERRIAAIFARPKPKTDTAATEGGAN